MQINGRIEDMDKFLFLFDEKIQKLINSFAYCFKISACIFSPEMNTIFNSKPNHICDYCQLIQEKLGLRYRCREQDKLMCKQCEKSKKPLVYQCHAGLMETVIPLKLNNRLVGYSMIGQFRNREDVPQEICKNWLQKHTDLKELQQAFLNQPYYEKTAIDNIINLFEMLCSYIVSREYIKIRQPSVADKVILYIEQNISVPILLDEVADKLRLSRSSISHIIKRDLQISFKQLCIQKKIEQFENLVKNNSGIPLQEAAFLVGYNDPLYFSRVYKKVRSITPSAFQKSIREAAE